MTTRVLVAPDTLYDWDAANYALGLQAYDVYQHQPHPPGSPLFWLLLKTFSWLPGPATPFIVVNVVLTCAILLLLAAMVRETTGSWLAMLVAASFAAGPIFWHHGATSTAYVTECFCSVLVAGAAWALSRRRVGFVSAGLLFAVAGGLRPNVIVTLGLLFVLGLVLSRPTWRNGLAAILAAIVGCACWFLPMIAASGGWDSYQLAASALAGWQLNIGSLFAGDTGHLLPKGRELLTYLLDGANLIWLALAVNVLAKLVQRRVDGRRLLFILAWFIPGAFLYLTHHLPKSGYTLTLLPALFVAVAWTMGHRSQRPKSRWTRWQARFNIAALVLFIAVNGLCFFFAVPAELARYRDASMAVPNPVIVTGDYGVVSLAYRTYPQRRVNRILRQLGDGDLALFLFGSHELHRIASFYHPDRWMVATSIDHRAALSNRAGDRCLHTFGDYQRAVLQSPPSRTWGEPTRVSWIGGLNLERRGKRHSVQLRPPKRLVVFFHCGPCRIVVGPGLRRQRSLHVGGRYRAVVLTMDR